MLDENDGGQSPLSRLQNLRGRKEGEATCVGCQVVLEYIEHASIEKRSKVKEQKDEAGEQEDQSSAEHREDDGKRLRT